MGRTKNMLTRKALNDLFVSLSNDLSELKLVPDKMILFGSYAKECIHEYSDVDIAIWNRRFTGNGIVDIELIRPILRKSKGLLDIKFYPSDANSQNFDPFIDEIIKSGKEWDIEHKCFKDKVSK